MFVISKRGSGYPLTHMFVNLKISKLKRGLNHVIVDNHLQDSREGGAVRSKKEREKITACGSDWKKWTSVCYQRKSEHRYSTLAKAAMDKRFVSFLK